VVPRAPTITSHPESQTLIAGTTLALSVMATSTVPLSYQWRVEGLALGGATDSGLVIPMVGLDNAGIYDIIVSNLGGSVTSAAAVVTVVIVPPPELNHAGQTVEGWFQFSLSGVPGYAYLVEASTNLWDWRPLTTTEYGISGLFFADPESLTLSRRFYRGRGMLTYLLTDFEAFSPGTGVMFQRPSYSGTTANFVDTATANFTYVTNTFAAGHAGNRVLQAAWTFKAGTGNWLRLTATDGPVFPNPTVDFRQGVQFDFFADKPVYVALGLRETSTTAPLGGNGGYDGLPIEWVGGTTDNSTSPPKGRLVAAGQWTTLRFFFPHEPIRSFTGNRRLESATGKGVLEELAIVPINNEAGVYSLYLDNFQVIFLTP